MQASRWRFFAIGLGIFGIMGIKAALFVGLYSSEDGFLMFFE
jgi:hypothetical protein